MKTCLITGSEGFIGSHLVEVLLDKGYSVRCFCLYNSFNSIGWLEDIDKHKLSNVEIIQGDIRDFDSINHASSGVDIIFHLAALIAIPYSYRSPESYIDTNIKGTLNVLRAALRNNVQQVIHTSTSEVYGTAQFVPITEKHPLVGQSPYSASKIAADQLAYSYYSSFGLPVSIVRPFNTYGPRQSLRAVIPTIISQLLSGNRELRLGNLEATRDFNFVFDTALGMVSFINKSETFGEVINLGSGREVSIKDLVSMISKVCDKEVNITVEDERMRPEKSEVERLCASNEKAKKILGWSPSYTLEMGLEKTYNWFLTKQKIMQDKDISYVI